MTSMDEEETIIPFPTEPIPRSTQVSPPHELSKNVALHLKQSWLKSKSSQFDELWNSCVNDEEKDLIYSLLDRFTVIDSDEIEEAKEEIANHIINNWQAKGQRVLIIAVSDDFESDGSLYVLQILKNEFAHIEGWDEQNFINNYTEGRDRVKDGDLIILLDDFIGSGTTMERKATKFINSISERGLSDVTVKALAIASMEFSSSLLNDSNIDFFTPLVLKKGISDHYQGADLQQAIALMKTLESRLKKKVGNYKLKDFKFGFKKSESLFSIMHNNVPDNVFPIFWWKKSADYSNRNTIFKRLSK